MFSILGISFVIAAIAIWARSWLGFIIVYVATFLTVLIHTDNNVILAGLATIAAVTVLYIGSHWVHNKFGGQSG